VEEGREGGFGGQPGEEEEEGEEEDGGGPVLRREGEIKFGRGRGGGTEGGMRVLAQVSSDGDAGCHEGKDGDGRSLGETGQATHTMSGGTPIPEPGPEPDEKAADEVGGGREGGRGGGGGGGGGEEGRAGESGEEEGREKGGGEGVEGLEAEEGEEAGGEYACVWLGKGRGGGRDRG